MQLGMVGLGRMGANMTTRLMRGGHQVVVYDRSADAVAMAAKGGATPSSSLADLVSKLKAPKIVWLMVPAGLPTESTVDELLSLLGKDDSIIDGGNSNYKDSMARAERSAAKGVHFIDAGTSGGIWGLENGYCLMVGGNEQAVRQAQPIFNTLAPPAGFAYV